MNISKGGNGVKYIAVISDGKRFTNFVKAKDFKIKVIHTRGHSGNRYNEYVDGLCNRAMDLIKEIEMNKRINYVSFHKRFAKGEQYLKITADGKIVDGDKEYWWQEREVYNRTTPIVERIRLRRPSITELELYGKNGIVSQLVPIQRAYNDIRNRKHEYFKRLTLGVMVVEDGSVDIDNLEEEGLSPGKVLIYRQGSSLPQMMKLDAEVIKVLSDEEDRLLKEFDNFSKIYEV